MAFGYGHRKDERRLGYRWPMWSMSANREVSSRIGDQCGFRCAMDPDLGRETGEKE